MLEQSSLNPLNFNRHFLKYRIRYYFAEAKELLARHKLLMAFIICLLAPGVQNMQILGLLFIHLLILQPRLVRN